MFWIEWKIDWIILPLGHCSPIHAVLRDLIGKWDSSWFGPKSENADLISELQLTQHWRRRLGKHNNITVSLSSECYAQIVYPMALGKLLFRKDYSAWSNLPWRLSFSRDTLDLDFILTWDHDTRVLHLGPPRLLRRRYITVGKNHTVSKSLKKCHFLECERSEQHISVLFSSKIQIGKKGWLVAGYAYCAMVKK